VPAARPPLLLDDDQRVLLEAGMAAVVAVNREGHPPQLTTATVLWDGETLRFATLGWSRRTTMLRADPRIGLLVEGPGDGRFLTVTGRAQIIEGRQSEVREAMWPLLVRDAAETDGGREEAAEARWQELLAGDADRAVIIVEPDQVLSGRR
jgi:nitroimidazol reductase NimA-like FMN-containing flavoprotein (pyridoxamine 5'-phosphate oxidase superfamily)